MQHCSCGALNDKITYFDCSRPSPLCFTPPNGAASLVMATSLIPTMPAQCQHILSSHAVTKLPIQPLTRQAQKAPASFGEGEVARKKVQQQVCISSEIAENQVCMNILDISNEIGK